MSSLRSKNKVWKNVFQMSRLRPCLPYRVQAAGKKESFYTNVNIQNNMCEDFVEIIHNHD